MLMSNYISLVYYTPVKLAFDKNKIRSIFKHRSIGRVARVNHNSHLELNPLEVKFGPQGLSRLWNGFSIWEDSPDFSNSIDTLADSGGYPCRDTSTSMMSAPVSPFFPTIQEYANLPSKSVIPLKSFSKLFPG